VRKLSQSGKKWKKQRSGLFWAEGAELLSAAAAMGWVR